MSAETKERVVTWERISDGVATITFNNPPMNTISTRLGGDLLACVREVEEVREIRVVILKSAIEKVFLAGAELKEVLQFDDHAIRDRFMAMGHGSMMAVYNLPKVTIAAISGWALGGGCEMSLCCDLRVMDERSQIGLTEVRLGILPGGQGTARLPRLVGAAIAKELLFTANPISADEAYRIRLINRVAPAGKAEEVAMELAELIATRSGSSLALVKRAVNAGIDRPLGEAIAIETEAFYETMESYDRKEGITAFLEKRKPVFKNC